MDFFNRQWQIYRRVVENDLMEHQALSRNLESALNNFILHRSTEAALPVMVDLGCGDLALIAPLLQRLPLGSYTGVDISENVLPLAQKALGEVPYRCHWQQGDLLTWALDRKDQKTSDAIDILHSSFAIHHLDDTQKQIFLQAIRSRIQPDGIFLWADVFREPEEPLETYLQRYVQRVRQGWHPLDAQQLESIASHVSNFDLPSDRCTIAEIAKACGWNWQWLWQGRHKAEALALLTPA